MQITGMYWGSKLLRHVRFPSADDTLIGKFTHVTIQAAADMSVEGIPAGA